MILLLITRKRRCEETALHFDGHSTLKKVPKPNIMRFSIHHHQDWPLLFKTYSMQYLIGIFGYQRRYNFRHWNIFDNNAMTNELVQVDDGGVGGGDA